MALVSATAQVGWIARSAARSFAALRMTELDLSVDEESMDALLGKSSSPMIGGTR
jgi:hypothetical protein